MIGILIDRAELEIIRDKRYKHSDYHTDYKAIQYSILKIIKRDIEERRYDRVLSKIDTLEKVFEKNEQLFQDYDLVIKNILLKV